VEDGNSGEGSKGPVVAGVKILRVIDEDGGYEAHFWHA